MNNLTSMKRLILFLAFLLTGTSLFAQNGNRADRVAAIKVGYISQRLQLTSEQAEKFWPVYHSYEGELKTARKAFIQKHPDQPGSAGSAESSQYVDDELALQQQVLDIRKKYKDQFLKVISIDQLAALYDAEKDFRKMLIQQLKERKGK